MRTCLLFCVLLSGVLAAPGGVPYGKKPAPEGKKPASYTKKPASYDKKPASYDEKKPASYELKRNSPVPEPRADEVLDCGSHVISEGSSYVIQSPDYPEDYPNYSECEYILTTDADGKDIQLTCEEFSLEQHGSCAYDWLEVNGARFCGSTPPSSESARELDIHFHSDYSIVDSGYQCSVTLVDPNTPPAGSTLSCGSSRLGRGQYTITDGDGDYSNNVDCFYQLYADDEDDQISVSCSSFNVERASGCVYDWLSVADVRHCGTNGPDGVAAESSMVIHWHTDYSVVRSGFECSVDVGEAPPPTTSTTQAPQPPADCSCGNVNRATRIVGGEATEANEYPWQAGLVSTGGTRTWCGGTVINSLYVLTAAHCTSGSSPGRIQVLLREHLINQDDGEIRKDVAEIKDHPNYNSGTLSNDFSLLKLASVIDFPADNTVAPACLPTAGNDFAGADAVVTGFGTTASGGSQALVLHEVTVPVITAAACQQAYGSSRVDDTMICAGLVGTGGKDSCQGDSGGPLVSLENGKYSLAGVVSWGISCADPRYPGVYSRVTSALAWIEANAVDGAYCSEAA